MKAKNRNIHENQPNNILPNNSISKSKSSVDDNPYYLYVNKISKADEPLFRNQSLHLRKPIQQKPFNYYNRSIHQKNPLTLLNLSSSDSDSDTSQVSSNDDDIFHLHQESEMSYNPYQFYISQTNYD